MTRASRLWSRIVGGVKQDEQPSERGRPKGSKAVIDPHAAARLSAVVRDGEFDEHAADGGAGRGPRGAGGARPTVLRAVPATAVATLAIACLWTSGRDFREFPRRSTHAAPAGGSFGSPRAAAGPMFGAGGDPGLRDGDQAMSAKNRMRAAVVAAAAATGGALAQDAVQWRVEDGGNGHWYGVWTNPGTWGEVRDAATGAGAHLATITSSAEQSFVDGLDWSGVSYWGVWLGAKRAGCAWSWITDEPWGFTRWSPNEPNGGCTNAYLLLYVQLGTVYELNWDDCICPPDGTITGGLFEWEADCNGNGIVDFGEIRNGLADDLNQNNVPDCCEATEPCCIADINDDQFVTGADLGLLVSNWGPTPRFPRADLTGDGVVDGMDLERVLANWGPCGG